MTSSSSSAAAAVRSADPVNSIDRLLCPLRAQPSAAALSLMTLNNLIYPAGRMPKTTASKRTFCSNMFKWAFAKVVIILLTQLL